MCVASPTSVPACDGGTFVCWQNTPGYCQNGFPTIGPMTAYFTGGLGTSCVAPTPYCTIGDTGAMCTDGG
jgi:hypothetical protein